MSTLSDFVLNLTLYHRFIIEGLYKAFHKKGTCQRITQYTYVSVDVLYTVLTFSLQINHALDCEKKEICVFVFSRVTCIQCDQVDFFF